MNNQEEKQLTARNAALENELVEKKRQLEIEAALERVRARTMAMQRSEELGETAAVLFQQLRNLDLKFWSAGVFIWKSDTILENWMGNNTDGMALPPMQLHFKEDKKHRNIYEAGKRGELFYEEELKGKALAKHYEWLISQPSAKEVIERLKNYGITPPSVQWNYAAIFKQGYLLIIAEEPEPGMKEVIMQFAKVFEQTYTRFLDLQKAEAQARESQIQLAMERVRARTMAMQRSEELKEAATLLFQQIKSFGVPPWSCGFNIWEQGDTIFTSYMGGTEGVILPAYEIPLTEDAGFVHFKESRDRGDKLYVDILEGETIERHYRYFQTLPGIKEIFEKRAEAGFPLPTFQINHLANFSHGNLLFITYEPCPEAHDIFIRFAKVFEQTYTRFLDLQKAEAQARGAQIELGLERVRARAMAMQNPDELNELIGSVFTELTKLDLVLTRCIILIYEGIENGVRWWMANSEAPSTPMNFFVKYADLPFFNEYIKGWQDRSLKWQYILEGENKIKTDDFIFNETELSKMPPFVIEGMKAPDRVYLNASFNNFGNLTLASLEPLSDEQFDILLRFAKVFDLTYTRFNDLKQVEAQAREAQIQLSLERVRARTMAMTNSEGLSEVLSVLFEQFDVLSISPVYTFLSLFDLEKNIFNYRQTGRKGTTVLAQQTISLDAMDVWQDALDNWKAGNYDTIESFHVPIETVPEVFRVYGEIYSQLPEGSKVYPADFPDGIYAVVATSRFGGLGYDHHRPSTEEEKSILLRFNKEFVGLYTRFLDLQKAEAQAREAEIELGLERVRARAMAMHKSDELNEAGELLWHELKKLDIPSLSSGYVLIDDEEKVGWMYAPNPATGKIAEPLGCKHTETKEMLAVLASWKKQEILSVIEMDEQETIAHQTFIAERTLNLNGTIKQWITAEHLIALSPKRLFLHNFNFKQGYLMIVGGTRLTGEQIEIMQRFTKVFQQTYTRFLDLQKAEAQTIEAKIEASLERVRSKAMAMHNSQDLADTIGVFYKELQSFSFTPRRCGVGLLNKENKAGELFTWNTTEQGESLELLGKMKMEGHTVLENVYSHWLTKTEYHPVLRGNEIKEYSQVLRPMMAFPDYHHSDVQYGYFFFFNEGGVYAWTENEMKEDELQIYRRFTSVLSLTYKRYKDLKHAEAQTREAQIQLALERVRARTMAMQKSDELAGVAGLLFKQVSDLGIAAWTTGFNIWSEDNNSYVDYITSPNGGFIEPYTVYTEGAEALRDISNSRKSGVEFDVLYVEGEKIKQLYLALTKLDEKQYEKMLQDGIRFPSHQYEHFVFGSKVSLMFITYEPVPEAHDIFKRFGRVFEQTYTRFLDLQKAEAQAREAIKASSLDRVRGEIASMRNANDLHRITPLVWRELTALGVPFFRCGVMIIHEQEQMVEFYLSTPDGKSLAALNLPFDTSNVTRNPVINWRLQKVYTDHWDKEQFIANTKLLIEQGQIQTANTYQGGEEPPESITLQFVPFKQGMMYVGSAEPLTKLQVDLVQALADAFAVAYARYEDFTKLEAAKAQVENTLSELKVTQKQLIQSEKMASLGELTAGIAHEIQNPLNFVNNFSEVSKELLIEMSEAYEKGDMAEAKELMNDVIENLEKINQHGKRADGIVKGMLQHSRSSTSQKEPTDINALSDEYLRLSYHGLRAKDKKFNADFKTDFDEHIGRINIIPQDIGRVLLNLYNNAFYATNERKKNAGENYKPVVSIETKKINDRIVIKVSDNGNGIPQNIIDKIFQPFFTTKPTGQGTGLGLSLSYDIVKAHGGELKVQSNEGRGTEFIVMIPAEE